MPSHKPLLPGKMLIAPVWLSSLGTDPEADWADSSPPSFSYLHLTNLWHCFPHMCWSKAGRLFWLRAHRYWDKRLDALGITPRGSPYDSKTRTLSLPTGFFEAVRALTLPYDGELPHVTARQRWLAYRRMHALIHNLCTIAVLVGRKPVIPQVPCEYVRSVQQRRTSTPSGRSRFGVSHPSVVVTGTAEHPVCHLAPGTWRPGGPDQCYHNRIMSQFDYDDYLKSDFVTKRAGVGGNGGGGKCASSLKSVACRNCSGAAGRRQRRREESHAEALGALPQRHCARGRPLLQLDGLLPIRDLIVDALVGA